MGLAKNYQMAQDEAGFSYDRDEAACPNCIADAALAQHVLASGTPGWCDFCEGEQGWVLGLHDLFTHMFECLRSEYVPESRSTNVPGREWDVDVPTLTSSDLLYELGDPLGEGELADAFVSAFIEDWVSETVWSGSRDEWLAAGWDVFAHAVKTRTRFVFLQRVSPASQFDELVIDPSDMLSTLAETFRNANLVVRCPANTQVFRARKHGSQVALTTPEQLGAPPPSMAGGQRMSPPGIAFFYGALQEETALAELRGIDGEVATTGLWETVRDVTLVDLTNLPDVPSIFSGDADLRDDISFLRQFVAQITKPVRAEDNAAVDYVPTQVVAEYVRYFVTDIDERAVDGILYPSAIRHDGANVAFFDSRAHKSASEGLLRFIGPPKIFEVTDAQATWSPWEPQPIDDDFA